MLRWDCRRAVAINREKKVESDLARCRGVLSVMQWPSNPRIVPLLENDYITNGGRVYYIVSAYIQVYGLGYRGHMS